MYLADNHPTIKAPSATRDITPSRLFLVHGTTVKNYNKIMKDGVLKVNNFKWKTTNNNEEGIFCQLMTEEFEKEYTWAEKRIKLNISVLKDLKFDIYEHWGRFDTDTAPFKSGKGKYKRSPNMNKTIEMIKHNIKISPFKDSLKKLKYMHSHEIIIREDIDLKKYMID